MLSWNSISQIVEINNFDTIYESVLDKEFSLSKNFHLKIYKDSTIVIYAKYPTDDRYHVICNKYTVSGDTLEVNQNDLLYVTEITVSYEKSTKKKSKEVEVCWIIFASGYELGKESDTVIINDKDTLYTQVSNTCVMYNKRFKSFKLLGYNFDYRVVLKKGYYGRIFIEYVAIESEKYYNSDQLFYIEELGKYVKVRV